MTLYHLGVQKPDDRESVEYRVWSFLNDWELANHGSLPVVEAVCDRQVHEVDMLAVAVLLRDYQRALPYLLDRGP